jgi:hypothetical protein
MSHVDEKNQGQMEEIKLVIDLIKRLDSLEKV